MKKIKITLLALLFLPVVPLYAVDFISNVEIIRFSDVTIRASDMQPVPVLGFESVPEYVEGSGKLLVQYEIDNSAPRDTVFLVTINDKHQEEISIKEGDTSGDFSINFTPETETEIAISGIVLTLSSEGDEVIFESPFSKELSNSLKMQIYRPAFRPDTEQQEMIEMIKTLQKLIELLTKQQALGA